MVQHLTLVLLTSCGAGVACGGALRAGAAAVEITPPVGMPLWGYASRHDAPGVGVRDPLFARCVVLDDGGERVAVVSLDLGRPPGRDRVAAIRRRLALHSIHHIFLVASHTHHGPVVELDNLPDPNNPYARQIEHAIYEVVTKALRESRPARLATAGKTVALNRNRQSRRSDAPVDQTLTVVRVESDDGRVLATLVNFAAHPTTLPAKLLEYSADFPGVAARRVEVATRAPCLFLQGASGDLSAQSPAGQAGPESIGEALAAASLELSREVRPIPREAKICGSREIFRFSSSLDVGDPLVKFGLGKVFFPAMMDFYEKEYREGVRPEVTVVTLGDALGLVGFSGEMFCGHALGLRRRARMDQLMVFGCCNDYQQYFPTIEATAEGGYGTAPPIALAEVGAGERMADRALVHLYRLRGKRPG